MHPAEAKKWLSAPTPMPGQLRWHVASGTYREVTRLQPRLFNAKPHASGSGVPFVSVERERLPEQDSGSARGDQYRENLVLAHDHIGILDDPQDLADSADVPITRSRPVEKQPLIRPRSGLALPRERHRPAETHHQRRRTRRCPVGRRRSRAATIEGWSDLDRMDGPDLCSRPQRRCPRWTQLRRGYPPDGGRGMSTSAGSPGIAVGVRLLIHRHRTQARVRPGRGLVPSHRLPT